MKIIKRIPLEAYAYEELEFESLEDYEENYPKYVQTFRRVRAKIKSQEPPFEDNQLNDRETYTEHYNNLKANR